MSISKFQRNLKKSGLVLALLIGLLAISGVSVMAQRRGNDDDNYRNQNRRRDRDRNNDRRNNDDYNRNRRDNRNNRNDGYYGNNGGYYGNNNYNNLYQVARRNGYQDGLNKGAEEAAEGDRYNPQSTRPYKSGTNGYYRGLGDKNTYKQAYRQAFLQGFRQGYSRNRDRYNRNRRGY